MAIGSTSPCNTLTGFSVDLWQEIARRLNLEFEWVYVATRTGQLQAVARGDAEVAISERANS